MARDYGPDDRESRGRAAANEKESFIGAHFKGVVSTSSMKFLGNGGMSITLHVPPDHIPDALCLRHLIRDPVPLEITLEVADDFERVVQEQQDRTEERLQEAV